MSAVWKLVGGPNDGAVVETESPYLVVCTPNDPESDRFDIRRGRYTPVNGSQIMMWRGWDDE